MARLRYSAKRANEVLILGWDFVDALGETGDSLLGAQSVSVTVFRGTDPNPNGLKSGPALLANTTQVIQQLQGGVAGVTYALEFSVQTVGGNTLHGVGDDGLLPLLAVV